METFIAYEKLSKKKRKQMNVAKRRTWGDVKPITKIKASAKLYNRKKKNLTSYRYDCSDPSGFLSALMQQFNTDWPYKYILPVNPAVPPYNFPAFY